MGKHDNELVALIEELLHQAPVVASHERDPRALARPFFGGIGTAATGQFHQIGFGTSPFLTLRAACVREVRGRVRESGVPCLRCAQLDTRLAHPV